MLYGQALLVVGNVLLETGNVLRRRGDADARVACEDDFFEVVGKGEFVIYKADSDSRRVTVTQLPSIKAGGKGTLKANLDTKGLPAGEALFILSLTTNSPLRPIVNLYITGYIK